MGWLTDAGMFVVTVGMCILGGDFLRQILRRRRVLGECPTPLESFADVTLPLGLASVGSAPLMITIIERFALPIPSVIPLSIVAFLLFGAWRHAEHALWCGKSARAIRLQNRQAINDAEEMLVSAVTPASAISAITPPSENKVQIQSIGRFS